MSKKSKVVDFPVKRDNSGQKCGEDLWLQRLFEGMSDQFHGRVSIVQEFNNKLLLELTPEDRGRKVQALIKGRPNESGLPLVTVDNGSGPVIVQGLPSAVLAVIMR
jgi:hypothetical protein